MIVFLYIFLALSLASGVLIKLSPFPAVNIYLFDVVSLIIVLFSVKPIFLFIRTGYKYLLPVFLFFGAGAFGFLSVIGSFGILEIASSIAYMVRLFLYLALFIPLLQLSKKQLISIRNWLMYSGILFVAIGYVQYIYYPDLRNLYYSGWDEHLYRLFSTFLDPNFAGVFIVLILLLYAYYILDLLPKIDNKRKLALIGGFLAILPAMFLTYSRSTLIVFVCVSVVLSIFINKKRYILGLVAIVTIGILIIPKNLAGEGVNLARTVSVFARVKYMQQVFQLFLDHPLFGVGYNTLRYTTEQYGFVKGAEVLKSHAAAGAPNSYLVILVTTGIAGFLAAIYWIGTIVKREFKIVRNDKNRETKIFAIIVLTSFLGVLVGGVFENIFFYSPILIWLVLITGILFGVRKGSK